ncbi:MAG: aspartyl protease family protein [Phycisphaerales bacterium]|nr:aspartyl protease family protein [Phycisphaerales bacterium]
MLIRRTCVSALFFVRTALIIVVFAAPSHAGPPPQDILGAYADAVGGRGKLEAVQTIYTRMSLQMGGLKGSFETWFTARGMYREHLRLGDIFETFVVFDGTSAWTKDHNRRVLELAGADFENTVSSAYLGCFAHLVAGRMKGDVKIPTTDARASELTFVVRPHRGTPVTFHLDPVTHLPTTQEQPEGDRTRTVVFSDWRDVEGIKFPFQMRQSSGDPRSEIAMMMEEIRLNERFPEALFEKPADSSEGLRFSSAAGRSEIPVEIVNNHIYLPVRVNGSEPLGFILDTGAEATALNKSRAEALRLKLHGTLEAQGAGGSADAAIVTGMTFSLPGVELPNQTGAAIPLDALEPFEGRRIDGVLGYELFSRCIVEVDYAASRVTLHDPARYSVGGSGVSVPIVLEGKCPHVDATVGWADGRTVQGRFLVDAGARGALELNTAFSASTPLTGSTLRTVCGIGIGGESFCRLGRVASLRIGAVEIANPIAGFSEDAKGAMANPDRAGLIGGEILRRFKVTFDYAGKRMILERNDRGDPTMEFDMSGLLLTAAPPDFRVFRVNRVLDNTPAAEAGLGEGDLIVAVDGRPAQEFTLSELRKLFRQDARVVQLRIQRNDQTRDVQLRLRRLI